MAGDKPEEPSKPLVDAYVEADKQFGKLEDTGRLLIEAARQQRDAGEAIVKFANFGTGVAAIAPFVRQPEMTQPMADLVRNLNIVFDRGGMVAKVRRMMVQLALDRSAEGRSSPVQLLDEAEALMGRPAGAADSPLGAFIAMRSAVNESLEAIRRRAPDQESTKGVGKIVSLGRRCGRAGLAISHFERLEVEWGQLNDKLSDGKSAQLSRDQIALIFTNGLSFLLALLEAIDGEVLKQVTR